MQAYNLAIKTGSEVLALVLYDENVHHYATEVLEPIINEDAGRKIIIKLLTREDKKRKPAAEPSAAAAPNPAAPVAEAPLEMAPELDTEESELIPDMNERVQYFKQQVPILLKEAEDISLIKRPSKGCEVCVLLATPAQKVVTWATPKLEPLFKTEQGQSYLKSILVTSTLPPPAAASGTLHNFT